MSELITNKITPGTGSADTVVLGDSGDTFTIPAGVTLAGSGASLTALPAANLTGDLPAISGANLTGLASTPYLHTVQTHVITTSSQAISANTVTNITNLNATITPTAGTKILVTVRWNGEGGNAAAQDTLFGIRRDSTIVGSPAAAGSRGLGIAIFATSYFASNAASTCGSCFYQYLDSPTTGSAITYHATFRHNYAQTMYNNRTVGDGDSVTYERLTSTITLQEVVAP